MDEMSSIPIICFFAGEDDYLKTDVSGDIDIKIIKRRQKKNG